MLKKRTTEQEHWMAQTSALHTVRRGAATVRDVMRQQGLCEIRAKLALEQLVRMGVIARQGFRYVALGQA